MTQFERDMASFREHAREMQKLGYSHVHVKYGNKEYFVETAGQQPAEHVGDRLPIGFRDSSEEGEDRK